MRELGVPKRKAWAVLGQHRSTERTAEIVELTKRNRRYGCRRITALLRDAGWAVNRKRVEWVRGTALDTEGSGGVRGWR